MLISVTPMVCITLAFWLGRIGLMANGGCCASAYGAAQMTANRIAKVKRENRFREIMVVLLRFWNLAHYVSRRWLTARSEMKRLGAGTARPFREGSRVAEPLLTRGLMPRSHDLTPISRGHRSRYCGQPTSSRLSCRRGPSQSGQYQLHRPCRA